MSTSIRVWQPGDVQLLSEAVHESIDDLAPFMPWAHAGYNEEDARLFAERQPVDFAAGLGFSFVVTDNQGTFLGVSGLNYLDNLNRRANLGYWIRSSATGRGAATAATRLVAAWAFKNTELIRLEIVVSVRNPASIRVAEKAGAKREGVLRSRLFLHGESHDAVMFSIVRGNRTV